MKDSPTSVPGKDEAQHGPRRLCGQRHGKPDPHPEKKAGREVDHAEREQRDDQNRERQVEEKHVHHAHVRAEGYLYPRDAALQRKTRYQSEAGGGSVRRLGSDRVRSHRVVNENNTREGGGGAKEVSCATWFSGG